MVTCKDCLHYDACKKFNGIRINVINESKRGAENLCELYVDKSRFVELPCKLGDTVYAVTLNTETFTYGIHRGYIGCIDIRATGNYMIIRHEGLDDEPYFDKICGRFEEFGKTVFLTREEAEKALKEMTEGEDDKTE